jgi:abequosyltransferase
LSVCIPAYNRPQLLGPLLDTILQPTGANFEIVICEDLSPERAAIREVVSRYQRTFPRVRLRYFENSANFGYDRNLRELLNRSEGEYCLFMGNDDLLAPQALDVVTDALQRHPQVGVIMRSYAAFEGSPENIVQEFRYFDEERFFPAGVPTSTLFFRRCVVISGLTLHRSSALEVETSEFDGTLLYQLHVVVRVLQKMNGLFLPEILTLYRNGGVPDFGNSEAERGKFVPTDQTVESSLEFVDGMLRIVRRAEKELHKPLFEPIFRDLATYSLPILAIQSKRSKREFIGYGWSLARRGFWRSGYFWLYFASLLLLGERKINALVVWIKRRLGYTPALGLASRFKQDCARSQSP